MSFRRRRRARSREPAAQGRSRRDFRGARGRREDLDRYAVCVRGAAVLPTERKRSYRRCPPWCSCMCPKRLERHSTTSSVGFPLSPGQLCRPDLFPRYYPDDPCTSVQPPRHHDTRRPVFFRAISISTMPSFATCRCRTHHRGPCSRDPVQRMISLTTGARAAMDGRHFPRISAPAGSALSSSCRHDRSRYPLQYRYSRRGSGVPEGPAQLAGRHVDLSPSRRNSTSSFQCSPASSGCPDARIASETGHHRFADAKFLRDRCPAHRALRDDVDSTAAPAPCTRSTLPNSPTAARKRTHPWRRFYACSLAQARAATGARRRCATAYLRYGLACLCYVGSSGGRHVTIAR